MSTFSITNANVVLPDRILADHDVIVSNGIISEILPTGTRQTNNMFDGRSSYLCPGFIDLHIHGTHDYLIDNGIDDLSSLCDILPQYGVTGFMPTVCPLPNGEDAAFLDSLSKIKSNGTKIFGFHLEGPFLTVTGALPPEALSGSDAKRVNALIEAAKPYKAVFSIAPDFNNIADLIPLMAQNNMPVFITHTRANMKQATEAIKAGACHATHFYNVFYAPDESDLGVRPCGAVEAILADSNVSVDFILDGEHVDPAVVKMALQCKGNDKVCLITDANVGAGNPPGKYKFGKDEVEFRYPGSPARGTENSRLPGALYGSGLTMNKAVKNAVEMLGLDVPLSVKMVSSNPAAVLRLTNTGKIEKGLQADLVLLNEQFDVIQTWVDGNCCYKA